MAELAAVFVRRAKGLVQARRLLGYREGFFDLLGVPSESFGPLVGRGLPPELSASMAPRTAWALATTSPMSMGSLIARPLSLMPRWMRWRVH